MRKIVFILFLMLLSSGIQSQGYTTNLDFFAGTWQYINETTNEEFTLILKKSVYINEEEIACLVGVYTYKVNGAVVTDTMDEFVLNKYALKMPVIIREMAISDSNKFRLMINDRKFNKFTVGSVIEIVSTSPAKIRWTLTEDEGEEVYSPGETIKPNGFSVPVNMVLTKVSE